jgi:hypothetical protein
MVWSGASMTVEMKVARVAAAALAVLAVLLAGSAGVAMAAAPQVAIDAPAPGSSTNSQTPPLSGTSDDPLDPVTVHVYGGTDTTAAPVQTLVVLALLEIVPLEVTWTTAPEAALEPGQYTLVAEQTNIGLETGLSQAITFTVDTVAPSVSIDAVPSPSNDATPTLSGGAGTAAGDASTVSVAIYAGGTVSGSPVQTVEGAVSGSTWSAGPVASLPDGSYTAQVSQSDEAGNTGTSAAVTFAVDTVAPSVSIDTVSSPSDVATPTLSGGAGTVAGDASTVSVAIYAGASASGSPVRTVVGVVSGSRWSAGPVAALPDGTYTARVSQGDEAGNTGMSAAVTFTIDTSPPVVSVTAPADGAVLNSSQPAFSGQAGQAAGDDPSVTLKVYAGSTASGSPLQTHQVTPSAGSWTTGALAALGDGTYTVRAEQSDAAGNTGTSAPVTFAVDTVAPVVSIDPVPSPSSDATPTLAGGAGTAAGDASTVTVSIYAGGSALGSPVRTVGGAVSGSAWSAGPVASLPDGTYTAQVSQSDKAGNTGTSAAVTFTVDTTPPAVSVTAPADGAVMNGSQPTVSGQAGQAAGDDPSVTLNVYAGNTASGSPLQTHQLTPSAGSWTTGAVAALGDGTYTVRAEQSDAVGNTGASSAVTFTIDTTLPAVTLTSPATGSSTTAEFEAFGGAAGTSARDLPQITVKLFAGSQVTSEAPLQEVTVPAVGGAWSAAFGGLSPGIYTARAQQSNDLDRTGFSEPVTFTVKTPTVVPPPPPPPPPDPTPTPTPTPPPSHPPATTTTTTTTTIVVDSPLPTLMQPFPVVRIAGSENASGVRVGLLTVTAPVGATVNVTCRGSGCPARSQRVVATAGRSRVGAGTVVLVLRRFERSLRAGAVMEIRVSKPGRIGKYTRFAVRRGRLPVRTDMCLGPTASKPIACPSS